MPKCALLAVLLAVGAAAPHRVEGQHPVQVAFANPQPHFVAAWAPTKEREAERAAVLARRVSLDLTDVPLDAALKALTNQAGLRMTYSLAVLPKGRRVTISAGDVAVVTALTEMLFGSGLDVVVDREGGLALVRCRHSVVDTEVQDSAAIAGTVTDQVTGSPIAGATVLVEASRRITVTDALGRYRIARLPSGTYTIRARYIGYAPVTRVVALEGGTEARVEFVLERSVQQMEQVVVTGTILPTEVRTLPTPVTLIPAEVVDAQRPRTTAQLFRQMVPSALAWDFGTSPQQTALSVRGGTVLNPGEGSIKVFVDGIEVTSRTFAAVDPASIDHIEVIRGPQAATIYGSDAIGGVMQIFTKKGSSASSRPTVQAEAALGAVQSPYAGSGAVQQEYRGSVYGGAGNGAASYNVGTGYRRIGNWTSEGEASTPSIYGGAHFEQPSLALELSSRVYNNTNSGAANPHLAETGFSFFAKPSYQTYHYRQQTHGLQLTYKPATWWSHNVRVGYDRLGIDGDQSQARFTFPADSFLFALDQDESKTFLAYNTSLVFHVGPRIEASVTSGIDHYSYRASQFFTFGTLSTEGQIVTAPGQLEGASRNTITNTGYFAQGLLDIARTVSITAGVRLEENSSFGSNLNHPISPRIGASAIRSLGRTSLKVRAGYGEAIQAPRPGQAQASAFPGGVQLANPELGPARQRGWDAGFDLYVAQHTSVSVTYYDQTARDLIQLVNPDPQVQQFQNVGRVRNRGVELEAAVTASSLQVRVQYSYTRSKVEELGPAYTGDLRVGEQLLLVPRHTAGAAISFSPRRSTAFSAGLVLLGERTFTDFMALYGCFGGTAPCRATSRDYLRPYPAFVKLNVSASQSISSAILGFVAVDNLTNNSGAEFGNLTPVTGRITTLGLRLRYQ